MTGPAGCEYGPTHWCVMGKHGNCNHRAGGTSARGIWMPECYVTIPPKRGHKGTAPIPDGIEHCLVPYGLAVIRPSHVYRCPCECHTDPCADRRTAHPVRGGTRLVGQTTHARPPALAKSGGARARLVRIILGELPQAWKLRAACRGHPRPDIFYPPPARADADIKRSQSERRRRIIVAEAKSVCRRCPVRTECLTFADSLGDYNGIWGGLTARERGRKRDER